MSKPGFIADQAGAIAPVFAVVAATVFGTVGLAVTHNLASTGRTGLQDAVDSAVLAGTALAGQATDSERVKAATVVFTEQMHLAKIPETKTPTFTVTWSDGDGGKEPSVAGTVAADVRSPFGGLFASDKIEVGARALARKRESVPLCVLALNPTLPETVDFNGHAELHATNCAVQANSADGSGMRQVGQPNARALQFGVTGNYKGTRYTPLPITGAVPYADPYKNLPFPATGPCIDADQKLQQAHVTLSPGTYCGGLRIMSQSVVVLLPGIYLMKDGPFEVDAGAVVTGKEVMFAFKGKGSTFYMRGGATLKITSPASGPYMNMQFFQDDSIHTRNLWASLVGNNTLEYEGVMYFPTQNIWIAGGSVVKATSPTFVMIGDKLWFQDHSVVTLTQENKRNLPLDTPGGFRYGAFLVK